MEGMLSPDIEEKVVCNIEIRETFKISKVGTIAGCYVLDGKMTRNTQLRVIRDGIVVYTGELATLKRFKDDVKEVSSGYECGLSIKNFNDIKVGDIIEGFEEVEVKETLIKKLFTNFIERNYCWYNISSFVFFYNFFLDFVGI